MNLNSSCSALADVRLEIFNKMEARVKAQFLELLELRERVREAELSADLHKTMRVRSARPVSGKLSGSSSFPPIPCHGSQ